MTTTTVILGGYQTDFSKVWSRQGQDLADMLREACLGAMEDARIEPTQVQSIHVGNALAELQRQQAQLGSMVAQVIPALWGVPAMRHEAAGACSSMAILAAMAEIEAGRYDCILVVGVEELKNLPDSETMRNHNCAAWQGREDIRGQYMDAAAFGRIAAAYEERYGLDRRYLNRIALKNLGNARCNARALTRLSEPGLVSMSDNENSNPWLETGVRRSDCAPLADGACALVLASPGFAHWHAGRTGQDAQRLPSILGWGHRNAPLRLHDKLLHSMGHPYVFPHVHATIRDAFARAGVTDVYDLSGIETHDSFTISEYMAIDHFGLTAPGLSWQAIEDGRTEARGRLPINPSGGLIGVGYPFGATGARMVLDSVRQVTGKAGDCQVPHARRFATLNVGGSCATASSFVVGVAE